MQHTMACPYCDKHVDGGCGIFTDTDWVDRRGGCPMFPYRPLPRGSEYVDGEIVKGKHRPGQQKQTVSDRKYDNRKVRRKYGGRSI